VATSRIAIRLDDKEKHEFEQNAKAIGITTSSAIKMFIAKFNRDKGFSYPVTAKKSIETRKLPEEVEKALVIAKIEELGLLEDTSEKVTNVQNLRNRWVQ